LPDVTLRPIDDSDLDALFDQMRDPVSVQMAAFTTQDPEDGQRPAPSVIARCG
jgi:hypothetical protein